ncbi:glutamine amidotransferase [Saprolegnia diclina VS20]|uniref:Imidazole glycerol phosphate synthase hisHF n=1 Tax=Saprolegnia diclina (strain VS20) TaxID=1156394 RepID=T0QYU4_SAPDV|nr:glutamine amidotransferase [Saprolegnia diclina VS20]EQC39255.1 glutamine amidotransferase [Saprolegnia diclina VS20]|eukprot:XP_008607316.1 glutamine amidotransferase [Saprolegnia diclina VS20]
MASTTTKTTKTVTVLDYGAGNVRSLTNALHALGYDATFVTCVEDIAAADVLLFPGVGNFQQAMHFLNANAYVDALRAYIRANKRFFGICLGMQTLFEGSEECPGVEGLGVVPGIVTKFPTTSLAVPHIGWNGVNARKASPLFSQLENDANVYFVHSFRATPTDANREWVLTTTNYGDVEFISAIQHGNVMATQFHPEKSGAVGLQMLKGFLEGAAVVAPTLPLHAFETVAPPTTLCKRVIACLDVRSNDHGDLVVTKGDQYDVREASDGGNVRNMGKPVELCTRYYNEGADEVAFLNITSFREQPLGDTPMLAVLEASSKEVFVPLTVGGGIRGYTDDSGRAWSALDVAARYFRAGADKVSIGSDAVDAAEGYYAANKVLSQSTSIEQISTVYGRQAVVISVDPRRVYVHSQAETRHRVVALQHQSGPNGETHCWYQVMVKGGREGRDMDVVELTQACEALGAGEILLNCVDMDGQNAGYDLDLVRLVKQSVTIPVVASSGAGKPSHFTDVFRTTNCDAALAAGIFHRQEVKISEVKDRLHADKISVRT